MTKTNRERADTMIVKWHTAVVNREHGLLPLWALNLLIDMVTVLVNKAERRGARKAADVFAENTALKAEIACLKYGTQPEPQRYTREEAAHLVNELVHTVFCVAAYNSDENNHDLVKANGTVVDAITGQQKPPQFDAEEVKRFIMLHGYAFNKYFQSGVKGNQKAHDE